MSGSDAAVRRRPAPRTTDDLGRRAPSARSNDAIVLASAGMIERHAPASEPLDFDRIRAYRAAVHRIRDALSYEDALPLQAGARTRFQGHLLPPTKGTAVMFHGFSAGRWQFDEMSDKLLNAGYNVYAARLPGHGLADPATGEQDSRDLVPSWDVDRYPRFVDATYDQVSALGVPVHSIGLSVGGAVATDMARRHPVDKAVLFAPFYGPQPAHALAAFAGLRSANAYTRDWAASPLDHVPYDMDSGAAKGAELGKPSGHRYVTYGNLFAISANGQRQVDDAASIRPPLQFFSTACDHRSNLDLIQQVYEGSGGLGKNAWFHFPTERRVPHVMTTGVVQESLAEVDELIDRVVMFLDDGIKSHRPPDGVE